jgi:hypothetical protein
MNISRFVVAGAFALGLATAAHAQSPQVPTPYNTNPVNPIATDGSPISHNNADNSGRGLQTGRSAYVDPVSGVVGTGANAAGALVGTGVGIAAGAVDTGLTAAGTVVNGGVDAFGNVVR